MNQRLRAAWICIFLAAITFAIFWQTFHFGYVNLDDDLIVTDNPHAAAGLSVGGIAWAFTHCDSYFYTPLTLISHMFDCQVFGAKEAGGPHFINVLLHAISAVLLFLVLRRMTGALWRSAFVAAVFAVHPLHVESVAWVSERKDVLSGLFFMLTLGAYALYAERPGSPSRYCAVLAMFTLALLSKPMVVTLPLVLLLLDYWPLHRAESPARLIVEKIPLMMLSIAASVVAVMAEGEAIQSVAKFSMASRVANATVSCAAYIGQMFHPADLAVFYPHPGNTLPGWEVLLSALLLVFITALVLFLQKTHRYLLTGWLWYLGMLAPVLGIVQVGVFARADRFTYLPLTGLCLMGTWAVAELVAKWRRLRVAGGAVMVVVIVSLMACAWVQTSFWADSVALWTHALECTSGNFQAHNSLGEALDQSGKIDGALFHFQKAVDINPDYAEAQNNLGAALLKTGNMGEALPHIQKALEIKPQLAEAHSTLGNAYYEMGEPKEAIAEYEKALAAKPAFVSACNNLAWVLATSPDDSTRDGARALKLAGEAMNLSGGESASILRTLAAAYAENRQYSRAEKTALRALEMARTNGNGALIRLLESEAVLYRSGQPLRRGPSMPADGKAP